MATSPSFASNPTIIWPGKAKHASCKNPGFVTAAVPKLTKQKNTEVTVLEKEN